MRTWLLPRRSEVTLLVVGLTLASAAALNLLRFQLFQSFASVPVQSTPMPLTGASAIQPPNARRTLSSMANILPASLQVAGKLELPRLGLSVLVVDGDEELGLSVAAVHVAGTSAIGGIGNTVIAGHRDTAFWPLRNLKVGDQLRVRARNRLYKYIAQSIEVVEPDDVAVLETNAGQTLTLVTCYPFRYVGSAPKRFIVKAKLVAN